MLLGLATSLTRYDVSVHPVSRMTDDVSELVDCWDGGMESSLVF